MCRVVVHVPRLETLQVKIDLMILLCLGCSLLVRVVWFVVLCPIQLSTVVCLPLDMILASCFDRTPMSLRLYLRVLLALKSGQEGLPHFSIGPEVLISEAVTQLFNDDLKEPQPNRSRGCADVAPNFLAHDGNFRSLGTVRCSPEKHRHQTSATR